ncbi:MAG: type VI secretion system accessory protein TagJ [Gemmatimonadota bacterium]
MTTTALDAFRAGRLSEAVETLGIELRKNPSDAKRRTFLFELLCFSGEYERAVKQLEVLGSSSKEADLGAMLYKGAIRAQRERESLFADRAFPLDPAPAVRGTLNGKPFASLEDADPRIGARLECFAAGKYLWLPLAHVAQITMPAPASVRDTLWPTVHVRTGPGFKGMELGQVLLPVLAAGTTTQADDLVRLGRVSDWTDLPDGGEAPVGLKYWIVDGEEFPLLELRELTIEAPPAS